MHTSGYDLSQLGVDSTSWDDSGEHAKKIAGETGEVKFRKDSKIVAIVGKKDVEKKDTWIAQQKKTFTVDAILTEKEQSESEDDDPSQDKKQDSE